jgi:hypothetical protein
MHFKRSYSSELFVSDLMNRCYESNLLKVGENIGLLGAEEVSCV